MTRDELNECIAYLEEDSARLAALSDAQWWFMRSVILDARRSLQLHHDREIVTLAVTLAGKWADSRSEEADAAFDDDAGGGKVDR